MATHPGTPEKAAGAKSRARGPTLTPQPLPMHPMVGNLWVPAWAIRPGAYAAVAPLADCMPLWLAMHSRTDRTWLPCYASRETLGATIGCSRAKVARQLARLQKAGLLFVVKRGQERKSQRHLPPARWALDPFTADLWREKVEGALGRVAEEDGNNGRWLHRAVTALDAFERRSRFLGARIGEDMPFLPKKPRKRKKKKRPEKEPGSKMSRGLRMSHEGMGLPGRGGKPGKGRPPDPPKKEQEEGEGRSPKGHNGVAAHVRPPAAPLAANCNNASRGSTVQNEPRPHPREEAAQ